MPKLSPDPVFDFALLAGDVAMIRHALGLSLRDISQASEVAAPKISNLLKHETPLSLANTIKLCAWMGNDLAQYQLLEQGNVMQRARDVMHAQQLRAMQIASMATPTHESLQR